MHNTAEQKMPEVGSMKNILIINTGGTFSSQASGHGLAPSITGEEIMSRLGIVSEDISVTVEDYCSLDSANIMPEDWVSLAGRIAECLADYDGFIVIHGTDTLAYTSSMLSFMLQNIHVPVVVTGSQMPLNTPMSDALMNLQCAVWMAASGVPGVFVAFDRKIMLGCRTSKVRTISFNAFESINCPYIGEVNAFGLQLYTDRKPKMTRINLQTDYSDRINECNSRIDNLQDDLMELPKQINEVNLALMLDTMEICDRVIAENTEKINEFNDWIDNVRIELKKNVVRRQECEMKNQQMYFYMHDISHKFRLS